MDRTFLAFLLFYAAPVIYGTCPTGQSPRFILEPQDAVLPISRGTDPIPAYLHCSHNSPDTNLTWYRGGMPMTYDDNRILHPNGTLEFRVLLERGDVSEDGVEYYCQLTNAFGSVISRTALLQSARFDETAWPTTTTPTNNMVNVTLGSFIMIPCDPPTANPPPIIEWTRDGTLLVPGDTTKYKVLSTEAGGGLIIANVNAADIGPRYRCRVTNAFVFTSRDSPVTYQLNQINRYPEDLIIYDTIDPVYILPTGSNAEFTCLALANDVFNLEFVYRRLDTPAIPANVERTTHDATTIVGRTTMRITGVTQDNAGVYQCVVRETDAMGNAIALGNRNFTIQVSVPPAITSVPGDQAYYTGDTHTLKCEASGFPTPVISYYFNATRITTGVIDGALTLTGVTAANNAGPYQCFADNVRANSSALWVITVRDPSAPVMSAASSTDATVAENANITLTIDISADPAPTATWTLNDGALPSTASPTVKVINDNTCPGTYQVVLTVTGFTDAHIGTYKVTVENRAGSITHNFQRLLEGTPLPNNPSGGADPHFMCPLKNGNNLCFSVQGIPDFIFNLFSDSHLQLNAKFSSPEFEESRSLLNSSTFMQQLGFTVKHPITNIRTNVKISALDHSISVAGSLIIVKNYPAIIKIINSTVTTTVEATPVSTNPGETPWVKIITDVDFSLKLKFVKYHLDFVITDSSGLSKQAHGIQGQFMGADVSIDHEAGLMKIGNHRAPFAVKLGKIWPYLNIPGACWYPVNSDEQGEGVIEGVYTDYIVNDLFSNNFKYK